MRIISGFLKGKSIKFIKNINTRPLKDSVKENIFNILKHSKLIDIKIENACILDLYSGVGSFGIECISRGAKDVTFIENNRVALEVLEKNLNQLSIINKTKIFNSKIEDILKKKKNEKFDVFFLDPPFADKNFIQNLKLIKENKLYKKKHIIIIHREIKTIDHLEEFFHTIISKKYGRSKVIFGLLN
tara:strand:- start:18 stop:578 length:561 start_codon:yes stop_codon:yes gene_type:complete